MKVSGASFNNGIRFTADKYSVKFITKNDTTNIFLEKNKEEKISKISRFLKKIPFIRGLVLFLGVYGLLLCIIFPFLPGDILILTPSDTSTVSSSVASTSSSFISTLFLFVVAILSLLLLITTLSKIFLNFKVASQYHGAEHKVIFTHDKGKELTLENCRNAPRVNAKCGTMLAIFFLPLCFVLKHISTIFNIYFLKVFYFLFAYSIAYEIFRLNRKTPIVKWLFNIGYWIQEKIVTREPSDLQLSQAIEAFEILKKAETGQMSTDEINEFLQSGKKVSIFDKIL